MLIGNILRAGGADSCQIDTAKAHQQAQLYADSANLGYVSIDSVVNWLENEGLPGFVWVKIRLNGPWIEAEFTKIKAAHHLHSLKVGEATGPIP